MTGTEMDWSDGRLDDFFAAARGSAPTPSDTLLARVLADAEAAMQHSQAAPDTAGPERGGGGFARWLGALGGWGGIGGLATATVAGLWFGYAGANDPTVLATALIGGVTSTETTDLLPDGDTFALVAGWEG